MNSESYTFCGQTLSPDQVKLIVDLTRRHAGLSRHELAATVCELLGWIRPNGHLKTAEARLMLEQLHERALIALPMLRQGRPRGAATVVETNPLVASAVVSTSLDALQPIWLQRVATSKEQGLWRTLIERDHYLGHRVPFGAHLRYLIYSAQPQATVLGCLQFSSPAWRMRARDEWIGWDDAMRAKNLQRILCNSRFLILSPIKVKNLASHVLALALRIVTTDWEATYGIRPYLAETLVDSSRFTGHCYRAANWVDVGQTSGRSREDRRHERHEVSPKRIFMFPLVTNFRNKLLQLP